MSLMRLFSSFATIVAGAILTTTLTRSNVCVTVNMAAATGVQTLVLPTSNVYSGQVMGVRVINAVAVQTVVVQSSAGTAIDTFAATVNGARLYTFNGTAWQPAGVPA